MPLKLLRAVRLRAAASVAFKVSVPAPPVMLSALVRSEISASAMTSSPSPASMVSVPFAEVPKVMISAPAPPVTLLVPPSTLMVSIEPPPVMMSLPPAS